ncbi:MAG: arylsulfatase, partial [Limnochordia bacterium]
EQYPYRGQVKSTFNLGCRLDFLEPKGSSDQFEMYNLTKDPLETKNLADEANRTPESAVIELVLQQILEEQRTQKRLYPSSGH